MLKQGKVYKFDNYVGYIKDEENEYMFLDFDLLEPVKTGDIVSFKAQKIDDKYRAFFIKKCNEVIDNDKSL